MDTKLGLDQDLINAVTQIVEASCSSKKMEKEELHPNQVKLDKNKNGKLDADDFKKLRKEETLDEVTSPMQKLKDAHERHMQKALAANKAGDDEATKVHQVYMQKITAKMNKLKQNEEIDLEEMENLCEISKATLGSYVKKAGNDSTRQFAKAIDSYNKGDLGQAGKDVAKSNKRTNGISKAVDKLTKEEVVDEAINTDHVNKDVKLKRAGAKPLGIVDKLKGIKQGFAAARKGESEDELKLYNKSKSTVKEEAEELDETNKFINVATSKNIIADAEKALADHPNMMHGAKTGFKRQISIHKKHLENASKSVKEELTLEDYSLEEIEEFMMSEDFEQLDELSKTTLGSYVKKATDSLSHHQGIADKSSSDADDALHNGRGMAYHVAKDSADRHGKIADKRYDNRRKAINKLNKLTKEQVEEIEALAAKHGLGE